MKRYIAPACGVEQFHLDANVALSIGGVTTSTVSDTASKENFAAEERAPFSSENFWE